MFQHILVPLDGSAFAEGVLPHVNSLAKIGNPTIHLLSVVETLPSGSRRRAEDPFDWMVRKAEAEAYLQSVAGRFQEAGLPVKTEMREGKSADQILTYASQNEIDLIVLSSHGQSGLTGWSIGSTVQKIIANLFMSLLLIPASLEMPKAVNYPRILLPLDGSPRAECTLPYVSALARAQEALLILAHVVEQPKMPGRMPPSSEDTELAQHLVERLRQLGSAYLDEVRARIDANTKPMLQVSGSALEALNEVAERERIDLVVLCAHGQTGAEARAIGMTGYSFIAFGHWPILIVQDMEMPTGLKVWKGTAEEGGTR